MRQVLVALDQLVNAMLGGYADETLSARAYRRQQDSRGWAVARRVIDAMFFWESAHCEDAFVAEVVRRHMPEKYRSAD